MSVDVCPTLYGRGTRHVIFVLVEQRPQFSLSSLIKKVRCRYLFLKLLGFQ